MKLFKIILVFISIMVSHAFSAEAAVGELKPILTTAEAKAKRTFLRGKVQENFAAGIMSSRFLSYLPFEAKAFLVQTVTQLTKRRVRFSSEAKKHDGLLPDDELFDNVVHDLFNRPENRYKTLNDLKSKFKEEPRILSEKLSLLGEKVCELVARSATRGKNKTHVFLKGGGRGNVIDGRFSYYLAKLYNDHICEKAENKFQLRS